MSYGYQITSTFGQLTVLKLDTSELSENINKSMVYMKKLPAFNFF